MRTAITVGGAASGRAGSFEGTVEFAVEAEKLGVDVAWSAEAWGYDAVAPLAYLGARTTRMQLGTGMPAARSLIFADISLTAEFGHQGAGDRDQPALDAGVVGAVCVGAVANLPLHVTPFVLGHAPSWIYALGVRA